jgi:hypothetical protein
MQPYQPQFGPRVVLGTLATTSAQQFTLSGWPLKQHKLITGITGQGKSRLIASLCVQLLNEHIPFTLIDPHADLCESVLQMLIATGFFRDTRAYEKLWYVPFHREDAHIAFNVLNQAGSPHDTAQYILEAWKRAWSSSIGDGSATALENLLLASVYTLVVNQRPLTDLYQLITDENFRQSLLPQVADQFILDFWKRGKATSLAESTLRRGFLLSYSPALRYSLMQEENKINARAFMDNGVSCLYDLSGLDPQAMRFLGSLLTLEYERAALSRSQLPENKRVPHQIVIDEFSVFVSQSATALEHILTQARKFGVTLNLACQTISQVKEIADILQNAIHITFKMGYSDANSVATGFLDSTPKYEPSFWQSLFPPLEDDRLVPDGQDKQAWARVIRDLRQQECLVHIGEKTFKVKTLTVSDVPSNKRELEQVKETYARLLLTKRVAIEKGTDQKAQQTPATVVSLAASRKIKQKMAPLEPQQKQSPGVPAPMGSADPLQRALAWEELPDEE